MLKKPIHISNVAVVSPKTGGATRVRIEKKMVKRLESLLKCGSVAYLIGGIKMENRIKKNIKQKLKNR